MEVLTECITSTNIMEASWAINKTCILTKMPVFKAERDSRNKQKVK